MSIGKMNPDQQCCNLYLLISMADQLPVGASLDQQTLSQSYGSLMNKSIQLKDNCIDSSVTSVHT